MHVQAHVLVHAHEQSYYIVHYIRRKEEGKEGRKQRTNANNLQQSQRHVHVTVMCVTYIYLHADIAVVVWQ